MKMVALQYLEPLEQVAYHRIKRHLEDAPLDELVVSSKKRCFGLKSVATPCTDVVLHKKGDSVPSEHNFVDYVKNVISKRTNSLSDLKLHYKQGFRNSLRECIRANVKEAAVARRYTLTACRRRMDGKDELEFKVFETQDEDGNTDAICSNHEVANQQLKEVISGSVKLNTPPIIDKNHKDDGAIIHNGQQVDYKEVEYDVFTGNISSEFVNVLGSISRFHGDCAASWRQTEEEINYSDDEDDENTEGNYRNQYPDNSDVSSESEDEDYMRNRFGHMKLVDSDSDSDGQYGNSNY